MVTPPAFECRVLAWVYDPAAGETSTHRVVPVESVDVDQTGDGIIINVYLEHADGTVTVERPTLDPVGAGAVERIICEVGTCEREAIVYPPPRCAEHGGLEGSL